MLFVLFLSIGIVSANEIVDDVNVTSIRVESPIEVMDDIDDINVDNFEDSDVLQVSSQDSLKSSDEEDVIVVNDWDELQYYCAQTDKDYTLKLKENTNFYPSNLEDANKQIKIKNNVKIIGSKGSWIGDSSSESRRMHYVAIIVADNEKVGFTFENVSFKWIGSIYSPQSMDGIFIQMASYKKFTNVFRNCQFSDIIVESGHSSIVYLKKGNALLDNCSFINCTTNYGCIGVYDPNSVKSTSMVVRNCYFENNYACTEPGCINNCGKLTVYNTTFIKNRSFWWAGAIHTHYHGNTTIYDSQFIDNVAGWNGGALYTYSYLQIYNTVFSGNNCTTNNGGGAIGACMYQSSPHIYIEDCLFENNNNNCWALDSLSTTGTGRGGAISFMDEGSIEVRDTTFIANAASIGTAICAWAMGGYGSPDVIIVNNSFINHTREGDTLNVYVEGTPAIVENNYFYGNSIVFSNLTLTKLSEGREQATFQINASLKKPNYYDADILDKTLYDVYINNKYAKTVNTTTFSIDFGDLDICNVYVIPTISNRKSNEVTATSTREYVFVSKNNGNDSNNGISRDAPVSSIKRALELARNCQNIILLDGDFSESNIQVDYSVSIKGEGNATLTGATSFITNSNLTIKNLKINDLNTDTFIKENTNTLLISNCIITNNAGLLVQNNGFATISNSILLNNTKVIQGNNADLDYNWWGSQVPDLNIDKYVTLNITSDVDALENNQKTNVKAVFYLNDGSKYSKLPEINLDITTVNGVANQNIIGIDSNIIYTLTGFSDGALTISYNDFTTSKTFEFLKSNPTISLTAEDIMVGDDLIITISLPSDAEGNLTVNVGDIPQSKVIESPNMVFTFPNLKADTYTISACYTGDKKYQSKTATANVNVNKYESTTSLNIGAVNVGENVILTITTTDSSTGYVTLSINNNTQTLALNNSKANYTIENIKRGDYLITAVYNGDDNYLTSQDSKFIEVDNLNATMTIQTEDITYGDTAVIKVTLNNDATGEIIATIDGISNSSKVINGKAEVIFTNVEAGANKMVTVFYSGDDTYFNLTKSSTFNIAKADLTFTMESKDIKIGQFAEIIIKVPAKTSGTFTINQDIINIPLSGEISYVIDDLEIGNYAYTATYNGNNYYTVSKTTSIEVSDYANPQWANEGGNTQNTHKSPYETATNGEIAFTIPFNQTLSGDIAIDSVGNVYLTTQEGVYCFNQTNRLWYFTSNAAAGNLSGIAIGRDVIIAPKSGDTLFFINQTTGERYGESNIYKGSSLFAPVIDSNATLYISSEYQTISEDYKLTIVPYKLWEKGGDPTVVSMGNSQPLCSPTLNDNIIVIVSDNRLRMIDAKTLQTIAIKSGNYLPIRPVIGEGNVVYAVLSDSIVAYNANGVQVWKTKVTGKVGTSLAINPEQGVYHINSKKVLYKYDIIDGKESKVSNIKVTSGLLVGSDGTLYFGSNSIFYALDSEGNVLWRSDLASKIIGNPVMDSSGLIYVPTESGVTALTYAPLKDADLKIQVDDIVKGQTATVTVTWNSEATGTSICNVNGEEITASTDDGKITKTVSGLDIGYYDVDASYSGDMRFNPTTVTKTFVVRSTDDVANNIQFDGNRTFSFSLNNAKGNLTVNVGNKSYSKGLVDGKASITVDNLGPGEYEAIATYSGDGIYSSASRTFTLSVPKFNVTLNEQIVTEYIVSTVSVTLPSDATGNLTLSIGTKKYSEKVTNGKATIVVDDIPAGNYTATLAYSGDNNYNGASKTVSINPTKIPVTLDDSNVFVKSGSEVEISVRLDSNATGKFVVNVDNGQYSADISEVIVISDLEPGNYTGTVTYNGDGRYEKASYTVHFEVPRIIIELTDSNVIVNGNVISIKLNADTTGNLTVITDGKKFSEVLERGTAGVEITGFYPGEYTALVVYSGDSKYASANKTVSFTAPKLTSSLDNLTVTSDSISIDFGNDATGTLTVNVNGKDYTANVIDGKANVSITDLAPGNYSALVTYSGDNNYVNASRTVSLEVPKIIVNLYDISVDAGRDLTKITVNLPEDATGIIIAQINGKSYSTDADEISNINIKGLAPGHYTATVTYSGDNNYTNASKTIDFEVPKTTLKFNESTLSFEKQDNNIKITINLPDDVTGDVIVSVNDNDYNKTLTNGQTDFEINDLNKGNYEVLINYTGDENYASISKTIRFSISMINVTLDDTNLIVDNLTVSIKLNNDAEGNLTVIINNKEFRKALIAGSASLTVYGLSPGTYTATVVYSGDDKYSIANVTVSLTVPKIKSSLDNLVVKSDSISIDFENDATGTLTVNVNGKEYAAKVTDGISEVNITGLAPGTYTATVTYSGDNNYTNASKTVTLEVPKIVTNLDDVTVDAGYDFTIISVNLPEDATGNVVVKVNGRQYSANVIRGVANINITDLTPENYTATVTYSGDNNYTNASKTIDFEVPKVKAVLDNNTLEIDSTSESSSFSVNLPSDATGTLTVIVNNKTYSKDLVNGKASVDVDDLAPGEYNATVIYSGDGKYDSIVKSTNVNVPKVETVLDNNTLSIDSTSESSSFSVNLPSDATGNLTVVVNNKTYSKDLVGGSAEISIDDLAPGDYEATVIYSGDGKYDSIARTASIHVPKVETVLDDNTLSIDSNSSSYSISLPSDATGTLRVTVDGKDYTSQLVNGKATVNILELSEGTHNITVTYSGDTKYEAITKSSVVNVNKTDMTNTTGDNGTAIDNSTTAKSDVVIIVSASDVNVGEDAVIQVTPSEDSIKLTVLVNNKQYALSDDGTVTISNLTVGKYNVIVRFAGDDKFNPASNSTTFNVLKVSVPVTDETITLPDSNSTSYSVSLPSDATGTLTVTVDGKKYTENLVNGKATVNVPELSEGTHNITVSYSGDSKYEAITKSSVVNVNRTDITNITGDNSTFIDNSTNTTVDNGTAIDNTTNTTVKVNPALTVDVEDINVGDDAVVNVKVSFDDGKVTVSVNGKDYQLIISNGKASVFISDLVAGNYAVLVRFTGDDKFNPTSNSTSFNVLKVEVPLTDETISIPSGDSTVYSISLPGDATGTLTVTVDGKDYTSQLVNGKATVNIPELTTGSHNITVTYSGDAKYSPITKSSVVTKAPLIELTGSNLNMLYTSGKYFKVRLTADGVPLEGQTVKITINGKTYSKTTNKDGYASMKISLAPKTYSVKASYGNLTITKKVVVKSVIKAKNVNAKKSAKQIKVKVTLKKVNGKYLKNKKVTLKFNKKTLKAKTNKKGVVTFIIKKNVYKKLKTNKKYIYHVIYAKDKVKKTIKFKK